MCYDSIHMSIRAPVRDSQVELTCLDDRKTRVPDMLARCADFAKRLTAVA